MKFLPLVLAFTLAFAAQAAPDFKAEEQARERSAEQTLSALQQRLSQARAELAAVKAQSKVLAGRFDSNERQLAELNRTWKAASGDMEALFAVSRQGAKDVMALLDASAVQAQTPDRLIPIKAMEGDKEVPGRAQLALLPELLLAEMRASARVVRFRAPLVGEEGRVSQQPLIRFGSFGLASAQGPVQITAHGLVPFANLPGQVVSSYRDYQGLEGEAVALDPARGSLLTLLAEAPTLAQRLHQGGTVGYIILALALTGLAIAAVRLVRLSRELAAVRRQVNQPDLCEGNALGRVLSVARRHPHLPMETLELRLDEAVLQETPALERGIGMVKVIAAVAPMLGLLGTVTGMIGTFQSITQFGTGDPKIMAGGISMALVTTVQGLIAAIPLILAHSLLQSRFGELANVLEQQVAGMLAERAEASDQR